MMRRACRAEIGAGGGGTVRRAIVLGILMAPAAGVAGEALLPVPRAEQPARALVVVDWAPRRMEDRPADLAIRSLQGIVNRNADRPFLWVGRTPRTGSEGWWLDRFVEMDLVDPDPEVIPPEEMFRRYGAQARGIVIPPDVPDGFHLALMLAAVRDLIVATPEIADAWDLPRDDVVDLRDPDLGLSRFADCLEYALRELVQPGLIGRAGLLFTRGDLVAATAVADYVVAHRLFSFTWRQEDTEREREVLERVLHMLPDGIPVFGSVGGGAAAGYETEGHLIALISRFGKYSLGCGGAPNLSLQSGWPPPELPVPRPVGPETVDRDTIYVVIQQSDGDNANTYRTHIPRRGIWDRRGRIPMGWTLGGGVPELMPGVMRYYTDHAPLAEGDEFILGLSGAGYTWPAEFARSLPPERAGAAWAHFLELTEAARARIGNGVVCVHHYAERGDWKAGPEIWRRYLESAGGTTALLNGYNRIAHRYGRPYSMCGGRPVFHTAVDAQWGDPDLAGRIRAAAGTERPAFVHLFWISHLVDMDWAIESVAAFPPDIVVVSPSRFVDLFDQARENGWVGALPPGATDPAEHRIQEPLRLDDGAPMIASYFFPTWWEPWKSSDAAVAADMKRLAALGVNTLLVDTQPSQAMDRDWHWLDRAHAMARESGLSILGWMEAKGGRDMGQSEDRAARAAAFLGRGIRLAQKQDGVRQNALVWDASFEEALAHYADLYLQRYLETGAVLRVQWHGDVRPVVALNVEAGWEDVSFDAETNARFREWLMDKYGVISTLNAAWGTRFASFDAIDPADPALIDLDLPPSAPDTPALADHIAFRAELVNRAMARTADRLRRKYPDLVFATEVPYPWRCSHPHAEGYRRRNACVPELVDYADILVWRTTETLDADEEAAALDVIMSGKKLILAHRTCQGSARWTAPPEEFVDIWSAEAAVFGHGLGFYSWNEMVDCHVVANPAGVGRPEFAVTDEDSARMIDNLGRVIEAYRVFFQ